MQKFKSASDIERRLRAVSKDIEEQRRGKPSTLNLTIPQAVTERIKLRELYARIIGNVSFI